MTDAMVTSCSEQLVLQLEAEVSGLGVLLAYLCSKIGDVFCSTGVIARMVDLSARPKDLIELVLLWAVLGRRRDMGL